ncbi:UDP-glucose 4-epimerase [Pragia fontium]|uniref:UDP-glucose 4-epimerase GalE n=1 Tax=Pragia fontium TaxID=82985 RepID=UPI000DFA44CB|nr:UDP-glucose 4-epimerase GalE [Pragia fontium]SUB83268.1 UDP-glucose 4-epimerase [Pragia fontium]
MAILVTGGAGYIGSHTVLSLLERGDDVVVLDNLSNSSAESLVRIEQICGKKLQLYVGDILCRETLSSIFSRYNISDVIHFAGLKSVGESTLEPLAYYENNVSGAIVVLQEMLLAGINSFVFSSSATVYGDPTTIPLTELCPIGGTTNPYGTSKLMVEMVLRDLAKTHPELRITALRYFNPVGAHPSGLIGEDPNGIPNNLLPYISQVAIGKLECLSVFGNDYPTKDGTGVRDYIHVMDLASGHLAALDYKDQGDSFKVFNLGTGIGYSVMDLVQAFERNTQVKVPYKIVGRRSGDIAECWSDSSLAEQHLGWKASRSLDEMMRDSWNWQKNNPNGYKKSP